MTYDRFPLEDVVVEDVEIPAGSTVAISVRSAHRDEAVFGNPERFDVSRTGEPRPLTFGGGAHACIGLNVARVEVQETLRALVERFPASHLSGDVERSLDLTFPGVRRVPVTLAA